MPATPQIILTIITLLSVGFLSTRLARVARVPHSVFLVVLGLVGGLLLKMGHGGLPLNVEATFPDIVIWVLLPTLIFESGYHIDFRELRLDLPAVASLATFGLFVSAGLIAAGLHGLLGIDWLPALLFGALISATDPVAVVALFKEIGAPRRLATLVEGESLCNDATAIVLFRVLTLSAAAQTLTTPALGSGLLQFFTVTAGGIGVGLVFVAAASQGLRWTAGSIPAQVGLSVACAYLSFLLADLILHASGIMATLTVSLYIGNRARLDLKRETLQSMHALWEFLALCANTLVFLAVGISVNLDAMRAAAASIPITLLLVYGARFLSVGLTLNSLNWTGWNRRVGYAYQLVLSWGGLRGGLALALVLVMPPDLPERSLFLALASAVVLSTLLLNALTTAPLLEKLGVNQLMGPEEVFYRRSLAQVFGQVFASLRDAARANCLSSELVDEMSARAFEALELQRDAAFPQPGAPPPRASDTARMESLIFDIQQALMAEQGYYDDQLDRGVLSRPAYLSLAHMVTERLELMREHGAAALMAYEFRPQPENEWVTRHFGRTTHVQTLAMYLETVLQLELGMRAAQAQGGGTLARPFVDAWLECAVRQVEAFHRRYPHLSLAVQTQFVADTVSHSARQALDQMRAADVISTTVHAHAVASLDRIHSDLVREAEQRFHPSLTDFLRTIPLFQPLPEDALRAAEGGVAHRTVPSGAAVTRAGDPATAFYVIFSGELEVRKDAEARARLGPGDVIGEWCLYTSQPWGETVVARVESDLLEFPRALMERICEQWPQARSGVQEAAARARTGRDG